MDKSSFVLTQLVLAKRVKATYEQCMQGMQTRFDSRFDKIETELESIASNMRSILLALQKLESSESKNGIKSGHVLNSSSAVDGRKNDLSDTDTVQTNVTYSKSTKPSKSRHSKKNKSLRANSISTETRSSKLNSGVIHETSASTSKVTADIIFLRDGENSHRQYLDGNEPGASDAGTWPKQAKGQARPSNRKLAREHHLHLVSFVAQDSSSEEEQDEHPRICGSRRANVLLKNLNWSKFMHYFFGISEPDHSVNDPGSRTIHPSSPFMAGVNSLQCSSC